MRNSVPIFWCLSAKTQAALMQYQHDNYGVKLEVISGPVAEEPDIQIDVGLESPEEIAQLMKIPTKWKKHPQVRGGDSRD